MPMKSYVTFALGLITLLLYILFANYLKWLGELGNVKFGDLQFGNLVICYSQII
jgi:hypothetical protein